MLEIRGIPFEVIIQRKANRNMYLRLKENTITVTAPYLFPEYKIYQFIEKRREWIYKAYLKQQDRKQRSMTYHEGDVFYVFGKEFRLVRQIGRKAVRIGEETIHLTGKGDETDIRYLYKQLEKQLLSQAQFFLQKYRYILDDYGYHQHPELGCQLMTSRWGVCYPKKNKININTYLIHYPLDCLEYIILHELTHFIVPNHSRRFYDIVERNMPDYKTALKKLK